MLLVSVILNLKIDLTSGTCTSINEYWDGYLNLCPVLYHNACLDGVYWYLGVQGSGLVLVIKPGHVTSRD